VWAQQFVHWMHHAQLPVRRNHERLDHGMCVQPRKTFKKLSALVSTRVAHFSARNIKQGYIDVAMRTSG